MSSLLLKIYAILIVITLTISSTLLRRDSTAPEAIPYPSFVTGQPDFKAQETYIPLISSSTPTQDTLNTIKPEVTTIARVATTSDHATTGTTPTNSPPLEIDTPETNHSYRTTREDPCVSPLSYRLGFFDSRFGISKDYFLEILNNSATFWNKASGKTLFVYDENAGQESITINLIYDKRQAMTDDSKLLGAEIENTKNAALQLEKEYEAMKITFSQQKDEYLAEVTAFNIRQKAYSENVASWNEKGGAPRAEYDALNLEKEYLTKTAITIDQKHTALTKLLADINTKITRHNELVIFANEKIKENNLTANKKFTEGNYNSGAQKISIYQFTDDIKLKRVLTHELGHALGITEHATIKESIMYAINSASTTNLTAEDIAMLKKICSQ